MAKQNVKNGTPVGNAHLCRSCCNGQFTTGYRESDVLVICTNANPARLMPFPVRECTDYCDRNRPGYEEMAKLALNISHVRRKRVRGFSQAGLASGAGASAGEPVRKKDGAAKIEEEAEPAFAG